MNGYMGKRDLVGDNLIGVCVATAGMRWEVLEIILPGGGRLNLIMDLDGV